MPSKTVHFTLLQAQPEPCQCITVRNQSTAFKLSRRNSPKHRTSMLSGLPTEAVSMEAKSTPLEAGKASSIAASIPSKDWMSKIMQKPGSSSPSMKLEAVRAQ